MGLSLSALQDAATFVLLDGLLLSVLYFGVVFILSLLQQGVTGQGLVGRLQRAPVASGSFAAAFAGAVTPFCSCSTVPIVNGFVRAGVPFGVCMSFLVASPLVSEAAVIMMVTYFGLSYAVGFVSASIVLPALIGITFHALGFARFVRAGQPDVEPAGFSGESSAAISIPLRARARFAYVLASSEFRSIRWQLLVGVLIGGAIHGVVPAAWVQGVSSLFTPSQQVVVMALIGIPLYFNVIGGIPVAAALVEKGMGLGPVTAFLITGAGVSIPELTLLTRLFEMPLILAYVASVFGCAVLLGFVLG